MTKLSAHGYLALFLGVHLGLDLFPDPTGSGEDLSSPGLWVQSIHYVHW